MSSECETKLVRKPPKSTFPLLMRQNHISLVNPYRTVQTLERWLSEVRSILPAHPCTSLHALLASGSNLHLRRAFPSAFPVLGLLLFKICGVRADSLSGHMGKWQVTSIYWSVLVYTIKIMATKYCFSWERLWVVGVSYIVFFWWNLIEFWSFVLWTTLNSAKNLKRVLESLNYFFAHWNFLEEGPGDDVPTVLK